MLSWDLIAFSLTFLFAAISTILFSRMTAKKINKKIKLAGHYYMCVDDRVGYTLLSMALAISLHKKIAKRCVPSAFLDVDIVKEYAIYPKDKYLSFLYIVSTSFFCIYLIIHSIFVE